jgi:hypothetical protein
MIGTPQKHLKWHQHVAIGGLSFETSTRPLNQKIGLKNYNSTIVNRWMQKNFSFISLMLKNLFKLQVSHTLSQPYFGQVWGWSPTLGKSWDWNPPGLPKTQKTIWRTKTPRIGVFLVSLKRSWNVDIENALAFSIWTSAAQVMGKRRAGSQTGSLTPDH